jgi:hypothetical protein
MFRSRAVGFGVAGRRRLSRGAVSVLACVALGLGLVAGCSVKDDAPPRLPEPARRPASVAKFRSATFDELRDAVHKKLGDGPFRSGQTLDDMPTVDSIDFTEDMPGELAQAFAKAHLDDARSPVIAHEAKSGAVRFIQLGPEGEDKVSLIAGRESGKDDVPNNKIFRIEDRWLRRLLDWDSCTRAVAGDSLPASPCGVDGCPIVMTQQRFVHPSGEIEMLLIQVDGDYAADVVAKHDAIHVRTARHCTATTDATGSCKLDCVQTPK